MTDRSQFDTQMPLANTSANQMIAMLHGSRTSFHFPINMKTQNSTTTAPESVFLTLVRQPDLLPYMTQFQHGSPKELAAAFKKYGRQLTKSAYAHIDADDHSVLRCFVLFRLLADGRSSLARLCLRHYPDGYVVPRLPTTELYAMDAAARLGDVVLLAFLHEHDLGLCSAGAMDVAAATGHLSVVRFLHRHRREGCTQLAFTLARRHGHAKVLQYLTTHCAEFERRQSVPRHSGKDAVVTGGMVATSCAIQ